jgi:hypothetical protein
MMPVIMSKYGRGGTPIGSHTNRLITRKDGSDKGTMLR